MTAPSRKTRVLCCKQASGYDYGQVLKNYGQSFATAKPCTFRQCKQQQILAYSCSYSIPFF